MADMRDRPAETPVVETGVPAAAPAPAVVPPKAKIAGFWRRLFALFIDGLLLGVVGMVIGTFAFRPLVEMGQSGRLIGAAITLVYYGVLNSGWGGGATLGKRMLGLRVVRHDGQTVGLFRSLLRTIVFWTPFYLNGVVFQSHRIPGLTPDRYVAMVLGVLDLVVVFVGTFLIFYFYLFNTRTRQSLHDLIAGTFVVRAKSAGAPLAAHFWKGHFAIATLVVALMSGALFWFYASVFSSTGASAASTLAQLTTLQRLVGARPGVGTVQAQVNTFVTPWGRQTSLIVTVRMRVIPQSLAAVENDAAETVLGADPTILGRQYLNVKVIYGYDLGISSWSNGDQFMGTLADWAKRLRDTKQTTSA